MVNDTARWLGIAIAGLINRTDTARNSRVPALGDLPVLGTMFRSVRYEQSETELLLLVTASLVEPSSVNPDLLDGALASLRRERSSPGRRTGAGRSRT